LSESAIIECLLCYVFSLSMLFQMKAKKTSELLLDFLGSKQLSVYIFSTAIAYSVLLIAWSTASPSEIVYTIGTNLAMKVLLLLLTFNTALGMWNFLPVVKNLTEKDTSKPTIAAIRKRRHYAQLISDESPEKVLRGLGDWLNRRRYKTIFSRDYESLRAVKGVEAAWGTIAFHCAFFLIIIAIVGSHYTYAQGVATIAEGEHFDTSTGKLLKLKPDSASRNLIPHVALTFMKLHPTNWPKGLLVKHLYAVIKPESGSVREIRCTSAWKPNWATYVTLETFGYAPLYELRDKNNRIIENGFVKLVTFPPGTEDHFKIAGGDLDVSLRVFPDAKLKKKRIIQVSRDLKHPGFLVEVKRGKKSLAQDFLRLKQPLRLGDFSLSFPQVRYWGEVEFLYDPMLLFIWIAFILGGLAIIWRLMFYKREIIARAETVDGLTVVHIATKSDYYSHLFARNMVGKLTAKLQLRPAEPEPKTPGVDDV